MAWQLDCFNPPQCVISVNILCSWSIEWNEPILHCSTPTLFHNAAEIISLNHTPILFKLCRVCSTTSVCRLQHFKSDQFLKCLKFKRKKGERNWIRWSIQKGSELTACTMVGAITDEERERLSPATPTTRRKPSWKVVALPTVSRTIFRLTRSWPADPQWYNATRTHIAAWGRPNKQIQTKFLFNMRPCHAYGA